MSYVNAPIHDLLIRVKNAYMARKTAVDWVVFSKFKVEVLSLLKEYHFIKYFEIVGNWKKKLNWAFWKSLSLWAEEVIFYDNIRRNWSGFKDGTSSITELA